MDHKKSAAVLTIALMLTVGMGAVFVGNDESEAVTNLSPYGEIEKNADEVLTMCGFDVAHATSSVTAPRPVANGTYINIISSIDTQEDVVYDVSNVNHTAYHPGESAMGIARISGGCAGTVDANVSSFTIGFVVIINQSTEPEDFPVDVTFNVVDLSSSASTPYTNLEVPARLIPTKSDWYLDLSATVDCPVSVGTNVPSYRFQSVTSGFGLSVSMLDELEGTTTSGGDATVTIENQSNSTTQTVTFHISAPTHTDIRMIGGETWTYTPTTNMTSVLSISGTATSWVSLTSGTISGTAPTNTSVGQTYDLTITASTSDPSQNVTQTITFTVDPQITMVAPASESIAYGSDVGDWLNSNFAGGGRSIYSITGGTATGFTVGAVNGVVEWNNPTPGTIIFTATSPYTYTSGATNTASATTTVSVQGVLSASVSGTLYLVTGKTVPNTPAEAVTLSHSDVGSGTYTWSIVGTNNSGVTVASDGTLGGTPGAVGTYALTVRCTSVVNGITQTADATLNVVIVPVLMFTSSPAAGNIISGGGESTVTGTIDVTPVVANAYIVFVQQGSSKTVMSANSAGSPSSSNIGANVSWDFSDSGNVYSAVYSDSACTTLLENVSPRQLGTGATGEESLHIYGTVSGSTSPIQNGTTYYVRVEAYTGAYGTGLIAVSTPYSVTGI